MNILNSKTRPAAALLLGALWISSCAANQAPAAATGPGSFRAIMSVKSPAAYGPHLPAADLPVEGAPVLASALTIFAAKSPGVYGPHLAAADSAAAAAAGDSCRPGSFAAVTSAKLSPSARPGNAEIYKDCR